MCSLSFVFYVFIDFESKDLDVHSGWITFLDSSLWKPNMTAYEWNSLNKHCQKNVGALLAPVSLPATKIFEVTVSFSKQFNWDWFLWQHHRMILGGQCRNSMLIPLSLRGRCAIMPYDRLTDMFKCLFIWRLKKRSADKIIQILHALKKIHSWMLGIKPHL